MKRCNHGSDVTSLLTVILIVRKVMIKTVECSVSFESKNAEGGVIDSFKLLTRV